MRAPHSLLLRASAAAAALGFCDFFLREALGTSSLHFTTLLAAFVAYPALVAAYTLRVRDGALPLAAAAALSLAQTAGMSAYVMLSWGSFWDDLLVVPLMQIPLGLAAATAARAWTRAGEGRLPWVGLRRMIPRR